MNTPKLIGIALLISATLFVSRAEAHGRWVVPSHTMLTGETPHTITLDMSISNELFKPDYGFIPIDKSKDQSKGPPPAALAIVTPAGQFKGNLPFTYLVRKSVGAVELTENGTYLLTLQQAPVQFRMYKTASGKRARAWGFDSPLPAASQDIQRYQMHSNLLSFVSRNQLTDAPLLNSGLEIGFDSHPNELFAGETARFQLLFNGKPLAKRHDISIVRGATRYRNDRFIASITTDDNGWFDYTWPEAGMYLIEGELDVAVNGGKLVEKYALFVTLEVAPE